MRKKIFTILGAAALLVVQAAHAARGMYPVADYLGDWQHNTNASGASTNFLSATNAVQARAAIGAVSSNDVVSIAGTGSGNATNYSAGNGITIVSNTISIYYAPTILTLVNNQNFLEIGTTVMSTILTWTLGAAPITSQSFDNSIGVISSSLRSYTNSASYTANRT